MIVYSPQPSFNLPSPVYAPLVHQHQSGNSNRFGKLNMSSLMMMMLMLLMMMTEKRWMCAVVCRDM